ncbi:Octaprenyl diphosphate synthase [Actinokineospora spheciospongiae]|uniref:Octaprenyl diphosphate synthase n=1 Tax=Actinokineospora spheciospongiae TaxID=909613 RepID=W7IBG4_9PSEU|nr:polyprenyl synthetase family protein [Actinokineospora spheciospongiae]EWC58125.1 Octaprenyl diphosphate synthase [Actinokineospora spheciospongiae]
MTTAVGLPSAVLSAHTLLVPALHRWTARLGGHLSTTCGYQLGLCTADGAPTGTVGGKLIRPVFTLLCAAATGADPAGVVPAAVAVELLHNASLVHDDIMDGDRERRHRPTLWARFGVPAAILAGDALIALAFEALATSAPVADVAHLATTLRLLARGQEDDLRFERLARVGVAESTDMIVGKTGVLLGAACRLGVTRPDWQPRFEAFGTHLGVAFQLADDLLGIWGDPAVTGKPAGADLRAHKQSAPVVAALAADVPAARELARLYATPLSEADVARASALVEEAGGRAATEAEAARRLDLAWSHLEDLDLDPTAHTHLRTLATSVVDRDH